VVVASAREFSDAYQGAVEDVTTADSQQGGTVSELVRSDVVFFETAAGARCSPSARSPGAGRCVRSAPKPRSDG
jgi:hypothetical protein